MAKKLFEIVSRVMNIPTTEISESSGPDSTQSKSKLPAL
jgi:hypothetical protein